MNLKERKEAFVKLGVELKDLVHGNDASQNNKRLTFKKNLERAYRQNPWFIEAHVLQALSALAESLEETRMDKWLDNYQDDLYKSNSQRKIAVILAGNIPAVGFHDFMCVLISGHFFLGKLSSQDNVLLPMLSDLLTEIEPRFCSRIELTEGMLKDFDAVIATGSNNTARYFEYYFGKYPNIIRKNRSGVAILDGDENNEQIAALGKDVFLYFGLGCRNVSKLFVPSGYGFEMMLDAFQKFSYVAEHNKYMNNYDYFKSIYLINKEDFFDNGFILIKRDTRMSSPVSVLFFENYETSDEVFDHINLHADQIQCVVGDKKYQADTTPPLVDFGQGQSPELWDYADNVDTLKFLISLNG